VVGTAANVNDVTQAHHLLHGKETDVFGDAGDQGADKREENQGKQVRWHIAMRPGKRKAPQDAVGRSQPGAGAPVVVGPPRVKCVLNPAKPDPSGPRGPKGGRNRPLSPPDDHIPAACSSIFGQFASAAVLETRGRGFI
jgi:hypothetical protein